MAARQNIYFVVDTKSLSASLIPAVRQNAHVELPPKTQSECPLDNISDVPVPCGHSLQIIWENCLNDPGIRLVALYKNGEVDVTTIGEALP